MKTPLLLVLLLCLFTAPAARAAEAYGAGMTQSAETPLLGFTMPGSDAWDRTVEQVSETMRRIKDGFGAMKEAIHEKLIEISNWFQDIKREYVD